MGRRELCQRNEVVRCSSDGRSSGSSDRDGGDKCRGLLPLEQSNYCTTKGRASGALRRRSAVLEKSSEVGMMVMECGTRSAQ